MSKVMRQAIGIAAFILVASSVHAVPIQWGATGHYYEYIATPDHINWEDARDAAAAMTFDTGAGILTGYLATLTSEEENDFAGALSDERGWLGGSDSAVEGQWTWVTGPEAGTLFFDGNVPGGSPVPGIYWDFVEFNPNAGLGGPQDFLVHIGGTTIFPGDASGLWIPRESGAGGLPLSTINGYWVEYGDTNLIMTVAEPSVLTLFGMGLLGLVAGHRRTRRRALQHT